MRWKNYSPAHDLFESESELLHQHGGRIAMALYRERRADIERHPTYFARRSKFGRQDHLPALSAGDAARVAASLHDYKLASQAVPTPRLRSRR